MKTRFARLVLIGLAAAVVSSCGAANSVTQTVGRMVSAAGRTIR